jgi:hypothetical protein
MSDKVQQFTAEAQQTISEFMDVMTRVDKLAHVTEGDWALLYNAIVTEDDLSDSIIPQDSQTKLQAFGDAIGNLRTILTAYTTAIQTNLERVA